MIPQGKYTIREIVDDAGGLAKNSDKYISSIVKKAKSEYYAKNSKHFGDMTVKIMFRLMI